METDEIYCVECKKQETDPSKLVTCLYCFGSAHFKCRNIIGNAIQRVRKSMYFCSPNCTEIYKRIVEMQNNKTDMISALSAELRSTISNTVSAEMSKVRSEVQSITTAIESSQDFLSAKFDNIVSDFKDLKSENEQLKHEMYGLKKTQTSLTGIVHTLEVNVDRENKIAVSNNAMILGLPSVSNENVIDLVHKTVECVGAKLNMDSKVSTDRLFTSSKFKNSISPIRVVFKTNNDKELVFAKKKENLENCCLPQLTKL